MFFSLQGKIFARTKNMEYTNSNPGKIKNLISCADNFSFLVIFHCETKNEKCNMPEK